MAVLQPKYFAAAGSFGGDPRLEALDRPGPLARALPMRIYYSKRMLQFDVEALQRAAADLRGLGADVEAARLDVGSRLRAARRQGGRPDLGRAEPPRVERAGALSLHKVRPLNPPAPAAFLRPRPALPYTPRVLEILGGSRMSVPEKTPAAAVEHHGHHEEPFWRKYIFSQDHKVIGLQYGITALLFLLFGFSLMLLMRWQLAFPGKPIPLLGPLASMSRTFIYVALGIVAVVAVYLIRSSAKGAVRGIAVSVFTLGSVFLFVTLVARLLSQDNAPGGIMLPEFYNQLGAMHGTIMVFLAIVPLLVGAFGNYVLPLQIGAPDMAFPKLNMASYWCYFPGGLVMLASFFVPGGAANSGWTSYPPLSNIATSGQTWWLFGMVLLITSSLLGSVNFITTIIQLRAKGLTFMRLPFFCWAQLVTSFLLLLAFPPLEAAGFLQLADRVAGHQLLHAQRAGGERPGARRRGGRQPAAVAAPVLVPRPPRGLRADPAGHGHRRRGDRQQHPQAAVGLQVDGLRDHLPRLHVVHRLGAPHVPDRHGHDHQRLLPDHHDDHLDPLGGHPDGAA